MNAKILKRINNMTVSTRPFSRTDESEVWLKMNTTRCSVPDITFDEDGNLDEHSAEIVLQALEGTDNLRGRTILYLLKLFNGKN